MDSDKILQSYVGRKHISRVKILAPWAKERKMAAKRSVFCNGYNKLAFLCNWTHRHEIRANNVNQCALLNLNKKILKFFP